MTGEGTRLVKCPPPRSQPGSWVTQPGCWVLNLAPVFSAWLLVGSAKLLDTQFWLFRAGAAMSPSRQLCGCRAP